MQKRIAVEPASDLSGNRDDWLDLAALTEVEITSEAAAHLIESALQPGHESGWRAATPGKQTVRLLFSHPQPLRCIRLSFFEPEATRTQEYVLRWSPDQGRTFHEIVRQQWNFSPQGATRETEHYRVDLAAVTVLELGIVPDISGQTAFASLEQLQLA